MLHVAVLGSGRGSNFQALLNAIARGTVTHVRIVVVISNNSDAGILETARSKGIPAVHLSRRMFPGDDEFVRAMLGVLRDHQTNFVVLAGYMKRLDPRVIGAYKDRIINIHPALLPKYGGKGMYGMHVHEAVVANHELVSGATVHMVDEEFDHGAIVLQQEVRLNHDDTAEAVAQRVLQVEHEIYPRALQLFAEGKVKVTGNTVIVH
jgi:phosphoribosylglycinamide formyltransferase-1